MVRGIFTGASGMIATEWQMNNISQNLANVNTDGYKRETVSFKAFPELLIRRVNDDGMVIVPPGSYDMAPVVGKMGTGVEYNESFIEFEQGSLQATENDFDLAMEGDGFFSIMTPDGERFTRSGSFTVDNQGYLVDKHGNMVLGENGFIQVGRNNFQVDKDGTVYTNSDIRPEDFTDKTGNDWQNQTRLDRLKVVDFPERRYLEKDGYTWYRESKFSGKAVVIEGNKRPSVEQGYLEKSNVVPVVEMTRMIEVQRMYEANQKVIQTADETLSKAITQVGRGLA